MMSSKGFKKGNLYIKLDSETWGIILTKDQIALISNEDYELAKHFTWHAAFDKSIDNYYVTSTLYHPNNKYFETIKLHRLIMGLTKNDDQMVDHQNRQPLNNKRNNLRLCTPEESAHNKQTYRNNKSSKIKNIYKREMTYGPAFDVKIQTDKIVSPQKRFHNLQDAVKFRNEQLKNYHKDFASQG